MRAVMFRQALGRPACELAALALARAVAGGGPTAFTAPVIVIVIVDIMISWLWGQCLSHPSYGPALSLLLFLSLSLSLSPSLSFSFFIFLSLSLPPSRVSFTPCLRLPLSPSLSFPFFSDACGTRA